MHDQRDQEAAAKFLTRAEAARLAHVSEATLDGWLRDGAPSTKVGRRVLIPRKAFIDWVLAHPKHEADLPEASVSTERKVRLLPGERITIFDSADGGGRRKRYPDLKQLTVYLPDAVYEQLRELAHRQRKKKHDLLMAGLDMVFVDRGLPSIAELTSPTADPDEPVAEAAD